MAVSVQAPLYSKLDTWLMTAFSSTDSDAHHIMAYQYPMGTSGLESSSNMIPSYHNLPQEDAHPDSPAHAMPSSPGSKNPGALTIVKSAKIKRSMSTPNVRGQSSADAAALALSAERRKNKLGYHRTAVACGHCRRRKIRCIPAPADSQNRCSNCIRLKKECNFYPVDQQPAPESRRRGSKAQSGRASESSSPSTTSGQLPDMPTTLPYPHLSMPPIQDLGGPQMKKPKTESFDPENKIVATSRNFDFNHGSTSWIPPDTSPNTAKTPSDMPPYWRVNPQDSPMTPAFSPFTTIPPPQNWSTSQAEPVHRDELSWSVPQRSMSYSNLESLQSQNQYSPYPHSQAPPLSDHFSAKPRTMHSGMYPPLISTPSSILPPPETVSSTASEGPPLHPHSAGPHYPTWQQQPYGYQKSPGEPYGAWSGQHGGSHPEEGHPPPPGYLYAEPPSTMYYPPPPQGR